MAAVQTSEEGTLELFFVEPWMIIDFLKTIGIPIM
jgi:hypothetical protein